LSCPTDIEEPVKIFFSLTVFLSAALLMAVQPMAGKALLPRLGGVPSVWNTCMAFFQAVLLAGYAYAWLGPRLLGFRPHATLHAVLLASAIVLVPRDLTVGDDDAFGNLALATLKALTVGFFIPVFALTTTSTLTQAWFARGTGKDPYFLYAVSNLGSFAGLLAYPLVIEPQWTLPQQSAAWRVGFIVQAVMMVFAAVLNLRLAPIGRGPSESITSLRIPAAQVVRWVFLAFAPSSLMLSVTEFLTVDLTPMPALWILPLGLYLLSFVIVFSRRTPFSSEVVARYVPVVLLILVVLSLSQATTPLAAILLVMLAGFFWLAIFCHGQLAQSRPTSDRLGEFYFWIAVGGVFGGVFNAFVAPVTFVSHWELPVVLVLIGTLRPQDASAMSSRREYSAAVVIGVVSLIAVWTGRVLGLSPGPSFIATIMWPLLATLFLRRPGPYAVALALLLASSAFLPSVHGDIVERRRSFFGVHRVALDGDLVKLVHGSTVHGIQSTTDPTDPRAYYHRKSPIAHLIDALNSDGRLKSVGVVGLGSGALAAYSQPGQRWTFFEIDPDVKSLAETRFRYLANAKGHVDIVIGDARRSLSRPGETFDLLVIDAFGSDAIPAHLLTREAMEAYRKRLNPGGVIAMHVSNRYLDLFPVLAELGWPVRQSNTAAWATNEADAKAGRLTSWWAALAADDRDLARVCPAPRWLPLEPSGRTPWTDDYINLLPAVRWRELFGQD
jgi:hypothetical protein